MKWKPKRKEQDERFQRKNKGTAWKLTWKEQAERLQGVRE
jgi:hypothetical protein